MNISEVDKREFLKEQYLEKSYENSAYSLSSNLICARLLDSKIELRFTAENLNAAEIETEILITNKWGGLAEIKKIEKVEEKIIEVYGNFNLEDTPFQIEYGDSVYQVVRSWRLIDQKYSYQGDLRPKLNKDGTADLKVWSPEAESVSVRLYDKNDQYKVIEDNLKMTKNEAGVWQLRLNIENTGLKDLEGYYYHYLINHEGEISTALDPYAPSMAAWKYHSDDPEPEYKAGKGAILDPAVIGPELDYAEIKNFEKREDAVIYEVHVRDLTSDPEVADELDSQFGTFAAFKEKLDYIESLGVTHIQLMPIMSYYFGDETLNDKRLLEYSSANNNYNWGYDPHSYFSISGMYSENPEEPAQRIREFKELVAEIHSRKLGVILDVVYNHTAKVHLFEDLQPNYYHFMKLDGSAKTSFGGGRLAATHAMTRKLMLDSISYWVDEFKVDGFRFDMMGDHDAESIEMAYQRAREFNPNILMIGEGWRTYEGDDLYPDVKAADQDWMQETDTVGSFSDDYRNMMKSGFGAETDPRFLTDGQVSIERIIDNIKAQPQNFEADDPGDVVNYIESHDNMTVHDVIALATESDPDFKEAEIQKRLRLGNLMLLTSQGIIFLHSGQEYGKTKQFRTETKTAPPSSFVGVNGAGRDFKYPYFIDDSYNATDAVNMFEWEKVKNSKVHKCTVDYTRGLIKLHRSTDAFRLGDLEEIEARVTEVKSENIAAEDLAAAYKIEALKASYYIFVNADQKRREFKIEKNLTEAEVIVDAEEAGTEALNSPKGVEVDSAKVILNSLSGTVIRVNKNI